MSLQHELSKVMMVSGLTNPWTSRAELGPQKQAFLEEHVSRLELSKKELSQDVKRLSSVSVS